MRLLLLLLIQGLHLEAPERIAGGPASEVERNRALSLSQKSLGIMTRIQYAPADGVACRQ